MLRREPAPTPWCGNTVRGLGGHLRFLGKTGSSWSSSLGLILLILKGHTSENQNQNIQRVHGPAPGIQLVLRSTLNFLYCLAVTKENCHDFVFRTTLVRKSEKKKKKKKNTQLPSFAYMKRHKHIHFVPGNGAGCLDPGIQGARGGQRTER